MLGHKVRDVKPLPGICLEDLVPANNFYRQVERSIDLSFIRELAAIYALRSLWYFNKPIDPPKSSVIFSDMPAVYVVHILYDEIDDHTSLNQDNFSFLFN